MREPTLKVRTSGELNCALLVLGLTLWQVCYCSAVTGFGHQVGKNISYLLMTKEKTIPVTWSKVLRTELWGSWQITDIHEMFPGLLWFHEDVRLWMIWGKKVHNESSFSNFVGMRHHTFWDKQLLEHWSSLKLSNMFWKSKMVAIEMMIYSSPVLFFLVRSCRCI